MVPHIAATMTMICYEARNLRATSGQIRPQRSPLERQIDKRAYFAMAALLMFKHVHRSHQTSLPSDITAHSAGTQWITPHAARSCQSSQTLELRPISLFTVTLDDDRFIMSNITGNKNLHHCLRAVIWAFLRYQIM